MPSHLAKTVLLRPAVLATVAAAALFSANAETNQLVHIRAAGFVLGNENSANDATNHFQFALENSGAIPFAQSAVKQSAEPAQFGPNPKIPYFTVRFAMPIPPSNTTNTFASLTGIDSMVFTHNHSPGFEVLPNGDCLAIYFSTPPGKAEADISTSFVQARNCFSKRKISTTNPACSGTTAEKSVSLAVGATSPTRFLSVRRFRPITARHGRSQFRNSTNRLKVSPRSL
jgi:hypothetical protein